MKREIRRAARRVTGDSGAFDRELLRAAYRVLLHREPDPGGFNDYLRRLQTGESWAAIVAAMVNNPEFDAVHAPGKNPLTARATIRAVCRAVLWREPSPEMLLSLEQRVTEGLTPEALATELIASDEFQEAAEAEHRRDREHDALRHEVLALRKRLAGLEDQIEKMASGSRT